MDINQYIDNFLLGQPGYHDFVLAREGPSIIDPVLRRSVPNLHIIGGPLAAILRKTAAQKEVEPATKVAREQFREEMEAGIPVDEMFKRTQELIHMLTNPHGEAVGRRLEDAMLSSDTYRAILAAVHAGTPGIPAESITGGLLNAFGKNTHPVLQYAVSASIMSYLDNLYTVISKSASENVARCGYECSYLFPALMYRIQNQYLPNGSQLEHAVLATKMSSFYLILIL